MSSKNLESYLPKRFIHRGKTQVNRPDSTRTLHAAFGYDPFRDVGVIVVRDVRRTGKTEAHYIQFCKIDLTETEPSIRDTLIIKTATQSQYQIKASQIDAKMRLGSLLRGQ